MNDLAIVLGYTGRTDKKTMAIKRIEETARAIEYTRQTLINKIDESHVEEREQVNKTINEFVEKYKEQIASGEYSIITEEALLVVGHGSIVEESYGVIVWTKEQYLSWDEMTEI